MGVTREKRVLLKSKESNEFIDFWAASFALVIWSACEMLKDGFLREAFSNLAQRGLVVLTLQLEGISHWDESLRTPPRMIQVRWW
jgi:hypothetical protein